METQHSYNLTTKWTGDTGWGTNDYRMYERSYDILIDQKSTIQGSSDPAFRVDNTKHNPEEMFLASISSCHMLWYLHLCAEAGVVVLDYTDHATGFMQETKIGGGYFKEVILHPVVTVSDSDMILKANTLHHEAHKNCFIANSCNFPILHQPTANVRD